MINNDFVAQHITYLHTTAGSTISYTVGQLWNAVITRSDFKS